MWNPIAPSLKNIKLDDLIVKMNELAAMLRKPASYVLKQQILDLYALYQNEYRERLAEQVKKDQESWQKRRGIKKDESNKTT